MTQGHFEAVKYAYRQSKDGFVLSFVVHPSDMPDELATAAIGSRFMVAFASFGDAPAREDGVTASPNPTGPQPSLTTGPAEGGAAHKSAATAPPSPKPNSTRAVMMARDEQVWRYLESICTFGRILNADEAERIIESLCGVTSKAHLNYEPGASAFTKLRREFYAWKATQ